MVLSNGYHQASYYWSRRWDSNSHLMDFNGMRYWYCPNQCLLISCPLPLPVGLRLVFYKYYNIFYRICQDLMLVLRSTNRTSHSLFCPVGVIFATISTLVGMAGFEPAESMVLENDIGLCTNQSSYIIIQSHVPYLLATSHSL